MDDDDDIVTIRELNKLCRYCAGERKTAGKMTEIYNLELISDTSKDIQRKRTHSGMAKSNFNARDVRPVTQH